MKLCITTVVDRKYQQYLPLFIYCTKKTYPDYHVKIFLIDELSEYVKKALKLIKMDYELVSGVFEDWARPSQYSPISWRFVIPKEHFEGYHYIYITDIDMMIMPEKVPLLNFHLNEMGETGLNYSNSLRAKSHWMGRESLSGLHFCSYGWMNDVEKVMDKYRIMLKNGDVGEKREYDGHMLYLMTKESGLRTPPKLPLKKRHHGIHIGTMRLYNDEASLRARINTDMSQKWKTLRKDSVFKKILKIVSQDANLKRYTRRLDIHCERMTG